MATVLHTASLVEAAAADPVDLAADYEDLVERYEPTESDWECYRRHLEEEERLETMDRTEELERIRRQAWVRAEIAVGHIQGVAAALSANGLDGSARSLLAAAGNIDAVLRQYA